MNNLKMHGLSDIGPNVPAFLIKLWKLVNDPETDEIICWSESGLSFIINNPAQFSRELLSMYYKHNNMASFIRQLNMYGFHKIVSEGGCIRSDNLKNKYKDSMEFAHQFFVKDHPYQLENIKRKLPKVPKLGVTTVDEQLNESNIKTDSQSEILAKVLSDVNNLKGKQESWDARLNAMKRENEALWRELAIFRQKHLKQEQIINRLIHFIVTIVQPSRNVPLRRKYPLMINDIQPVKKITKLSGVDTQFSQGSPSGPTIHEIDTADVIFGSPEQPEISSVDVEYASADLENCTPKFVEIENPETVAVINQSDGKSKIETVENIPEEWLEVQLTEDNTIDPLAPVDPAKVNPAVAAATLKHLESVNKIVSPIAITLPSITTGSGSGKKNITEKKIIYLTGVNDAEKQGKKNAKKPIVVKLDIPYKKNKSNNGMSTSSINSALDLVSNCDESLIKTATQPVKRKLMKPKSPLNSKINRTPKVVETPKKTTKKVGSKTYVPELDLDDLDFVLSSKKSDDDISVSGEMKKLNKSPDKKNSSFKLQSLYNGVISEEQLTDATDDPISLDLGKEDFSGNVEISEDLPPSDLMLTKKLPTEENNENNEDILNFEPESMAVVCQNPGADNLTRELGSHVDSVQGEIDYLKEMLKGEGYSFDANTLPWLFSDDPLSYGVLPPAEEEVNEKKNEEEGISGNELMTYGAPNLMDLVDMIGSTPSNQDWATFTPSSPPSVVSDLATPAPSPSAFSFPTSNKRHKF